jgi:DNA-binding transcriptional MerR regulator
MIGELSRQTGMPVKALREYADMSLIYTVGRSPGNYRLFDESALWCVEVIRGLRSLGLTVAEIREVASVYLARPDQPIGPHLAERLAAARSASTLASESSSSCAVASTGSRQLTRPSWQQRPAPTSALATRAPTPLDSPPSRRL